MTIYTKYTIYTNYMKGEHTVLYDITHKIYLECNEI